uniref:OmpA family protein n=1 Tax=candidate division WOR-3 bacterium TaxID=2052148 RepID=A0A7C4THV4_UNCW3
MKLRFIITFASVLGILYAQGYSGGAGAFLQYGVGPRALGLGNAFVGVSDDASAIYWNPAGLATLKKSELMVSYGTLFEGRRQSYLAYNRPMSILSFGLGWLNYSVSGISGRDEFGQPTGDITDSENAFLLALTSRHGLVIEGLNIYPGATLKILYQSLAGYSATGSGWDFSLTAKYNINKFPIKDFSLAGVMRNVATSMKWNTLSEHVDEIPKSYRLGAKISLAFLPVTLATDYEHIPTYGLSYLYTGAEINVFKILSLRGGYNRGEITGGTSIDMSLAKQRFQIHYGYSTDPIAANGIHKFGISYLGPAPERKPIKFTPPPPETTLIAVEETLKVTEKETLLVGVPTKPPITLEPIYFDLNKWKIKPEYEEILKKNANILLEHENLKVLITGHTSDEGSTEYNTRLGLKRAWTVKDYLVSLGVDESRIFIRSRGFAEPADLKNPQRNRRVEFEVSE